jgi:hypothetical protein
MNTDYRTATKIYKNAAGDQYVRPDKGKSYHERQGWHLLTAAGKLVCIVPDGRDPLFGNALNAIYRQLQLGLAALRR